MIIDVFYFCITDKRTVNILEDEKWTQYSLDNMGTLLNETKLEVSKVEIAFATYEMKASWAQLGVCARWRSWRGVGAGREKPRSIEDILFKSPQLQDSLV